MWCWLACQGTSERDTRSDRFIQYNLIHFITECAALVQSLQKEPSLNHLSDRLVGRLLKSELYRVVGQFAKFVYVFLKRLVRMKVVPLTALEHDLNVPVAVFVPATVPAGATVVERGIEREPPLVPQSRVRRNRANFVLEQTVGSDPLVVIPAKVNIYCKSSLIRI